MTAFDLIVPFAVATATIFQGGLNRSIAQSWGLPGAILLNALVFLVATLCLYLFTKMAGPTNVFAHKEAFSDFKPWYVIPGLCGMMIVMGLPIGFRSLGAATCMTLIVGSQIILAFMWDYFVDGSTPSMMRFVAALITIVGVVMTMLAS